MVKFLILPLAVPISLSLFTTSALLERTSPAVTPLKTPNSDVVIVVESNVKLVSPVRVPTTVKLPLEVIWPEPSTENFVKPELFWTSKPVALVLVPNFIIIFLSSSWLCNVIWPPAVVFWIKNPPSPSVVCLMAVSSPVPNDNMMLSLSWRLPPDTNTSPAVLVIPSAVVRAALVTSKPDVASTLPANVTCPPVFCVIALLLITNGTSQVKAVVAAVKTVVPILPLVPGFKKILPSLFSTIILWLSPTLVGGVSNLIPPVIISLLSNPIISIPVLAVTSITLLARGV